MEAGPAAIEGVAMALQLLTLGALFYTLRFIWRKLTRPLKGEAHVRQSILETEENTPELIKIEESKEKRQRIVGADKVTTPIKKELDDEEIYARVAKEMEEENIRPGLWAKATANAEGNEPKIKALYIKYRVQSLRNEITLDSDKSRSIETQIVASVPKLMVHDKYELPGSAPRDYIRRKELRKHGHISQSYLDSVKIRIFGKS